MSRAFYLYKKTHTLTGLQYLGYTTQNPYSYKGSGVAWTSHIKEHGYHVHTEVLLETHSREEMIAAGRHYSEEWDVVNDPTWANLMEESGSGCWSQCNKDKEQTIQKRAGSLKERHIQAGLSDAEKKSYKKKIRTRLDRISDRGFTEKEKEQHAKYGCTILVITPTGDEKIFTSHGSADRELGMDSRYTLVKTLKGQSHKGFKVIKLADPITPCKKTGRNEQSI